MPNHLDLLVFNWQDRLHPQAGGAETNLHQVFGRLATRGHHVTVVASSWRGALPHETLDGLEIHRCGNRITYPIAARSFYRNALMQRSFDVVVEDLNKVPIATPKWVREPVVLLVHHLFGSTAFDAASPFVAMATVLLERTLLPLYANCPIIAVSDSSAREVRERTHHDAAVHVIHNGVAQDQAAIPHVEDAPANSNDALFVYVGRLQRYKRVDLPICALAQLTGDNIAARLIIAGRGPEEHRLRKLAKELGIGDRVEFRGFVSEPERITLMSRALANVMTSLKEGWGMSILDAGVLGTPTIASDSPGLRDAIRHGQTGLLVPHGDVPALTLAMRTLATNRAGAERLGIAARAYARHFTWERAADAFEIVLEAAAVMRGQPADDARRSPAR
ncbi:MAG: glycosyltransferase family 4 protein [bacterium]